MRAIILLGIMAILVPMAFFAPFTGLLTFIWMAYTRPQEWAYANSAQYSLAIAVATILGYFIFEMPARGLKLRYNVLILLLIVQYTLATAMAFNPQYAQPKYIEFIKIFVIAIFLTAMTDSEERIRWVLLVSLGSIGFLTIRSFFGIIYSGGARVYGPGGLYEDNNDYAILLDTALPMMFYFAQAQSQKWLKYIFFVFSLTSLVTILFTYSRGGFLGLCSALIFLALKSKWKIPGLLAIALAGFLFFNFGPDRVLNRVNTIQDASEKDSSAQQRLRAWAVSLKILADHPFFGVGVRNIMLVYGQYEDPNDTRVSHNSYLQIVADCGAPALLLFLGSLFLSYIRFAKTKKILATHAPRSQLIKYAHGMQVGIFGYMASAFFASKEDLELIYTIFALSASCIYIALECQKQSEINELVHAANPEFQPNLQGQQPLSVEGGM